MEKNVKTRFVPKIKFKKVCKRDSGVTTDPADPAMRGARGLWGPKNYGINFFSLKIWEQMWTCAAMSNLACTY